MSDQVTQLAAREAELRLVLERNTALELIIDRGTDIEKSTNGQKVAAAIDGAELHLEPFPYTIIDKLLPHQLYNSLLRGIPPSELFAARAPGKEHLSVPFTLAPAFSQRVWGYVATELIPNVIAPRIIEKFREPMESGSSATGRPRSPPVMLHSSDQAAC